MQEPKKDGMRGVGVYFIVMMAIMLVLYLVWSNVGSQEVWLSDQEAQSLLEQEGAVKYIEVEPIRVGSGEAGKAALYMEGTNNSKIVRYFFVSNVESFREQIQKEYPGINVYAQPLQEESLFVKMLPYLVVLVVGIILFVVFISRTQGGGGANGKMMILAAVRPE